MSNRVLLESIVAKIGNGVDAEQIDQPSDGMLPVSRIETIWDGVIDFERVKYAKVTKAEIDKYALQSGDILFSHINSPAHIGKTAIYRTEQTLIHGINLLLIRVDQKKCYPEYLNYYFKSKNVRALFQARCKKAVNQASLNQPDILELEVPLPPLTEQKRIASLLARADRLRQLRRTAHELGDALLQSVFLEMFEKERGRIGFEELGVLAEVKTGGTPSREVPQYFNGQIPWVKTTEVVNEVIYDTSEKISEAGLKASNCEVFPVGTILIAMYGQGLTRGRTGKLGIPATTNQACAAVLPSPKINTDYLWAFLKLSYNEIRDLGRGGNQPNLNLSMVRELKIPVPPLSLQEEFAGMVARVESLRGRMSEAGRQVNGLFESVLSESFGGKG